MTEFRADVIGRRGFLRASSAAACACMLSGGVPSFASAEGKSGLSNLDLLVPGIRPRLRMRHGNTGEVLDCVYWNGVSYRSMSEINGFFRDWRENAVKQIDPGLIWGISAIAQAAELEGHDGWVRLYSGYRTRKTNDSLPGAARESQHLYGRAADFVLDGIPPSKVASYAEWLGMGGVGRYAGFTHVDTGRVRRWTG